LSTLLTSATNPTTNAKVVNTPTTANIDLINL
jgi:hypothetical protein